MCVHVCVLEGRAGQEKRGEEKVDIKKKNKKTEKRVNKISGNMVIKVWAITKNTRNIGKIVKTRTLFLTRYSPDMGSSSKRPKRQFFYRRCVGEGPNQRNTRYGPSTFWLLFEEAEVLVLCTKCVHPLSSGATQPANALLRWKNHFVSRRSCIH